MADQHIGHCQKNSRRDFQVLNTEKIDRFSKNVQCTTSSLVHDIMLKVEILQKSTLGLILYGL